MSIHRILFYLLLILLPMQLGKHFWPSFSLVQGIRVDYLSPTIYLIDLILLSIIFSWVFEISVGRNKIKRWVSSKHTALLLLGTLFIIVNIYFAINPLITFLKWLRIGEAALIVLYVVKTKPLLIHSLILLIIGGVYSSLIAWGQFIYQGSLGGIFWWLGERTFTVTTPGIARTIVDNRLFLRPYATFPHPNVLAGYLTCLIPFVFYVKNINRITKLLFLPVLFLFLSTILITFSQAAWIVAVGILLLLVLKPKKKLLTTLAITGFIVVTILFSFQFVEKESIERRVALTKTAFAILADNPFTGVGLNNFISVLPNYQLINSYQDLQPVHSLYLLFAAETGIVGIGLIIILAYSIIKNGRYIPFHFIVPLVILLLFGFIDHYPFTIFQMMVFAGILTGFTVYSK